MLSRRIGCAIVLAIAFGLPGWATTSFFSIDDQDSVLALRPITATSPTLSATNSDSDSTCLIINTVVCTQTQVDPSSLDSVSGNLLLMVPADLGDSTNLTLASSGNAIAAGTLIADLSVDATKASDRPVNQNLWGRLTSLLTLNEDSSVVMSLDSFLWDIADHALPETVALSAVALIWFVVLRRNRRKTLAQRAVTI